MKEQKYGINMKAWCRDHEAKVQERPATPELLREHLEKIQWLQHERLIHLIVTFMVVVVELCATGATLCLGSIPAAVATLILGILLGFYFYHYFFLENTVQRWYLLADQLRQSLPQETPESH
jgi:hypothetical protein